MQFTIPQTKIGEHYAINITTKDVDASFTFWQKFGFKELFRYDFPFPFMFITDGTINIMLRKDDNPYIGLTYYIPNVQGKVAELEAEGITFTELPMPSAGDMLKRFKTVSPDVVNLTLVTYVESFVKPTLPTMLNIAPSDYMNPEKYGNKTIGMFAEYAHTVKDLEATIAHWDKLGFKVLHKQNAPYPWAILSDGVSVLGCHQSTHFSGVGITYFAADMKDKIADLKTNGLTNYKEMMGPDNIVVPTPEGQQLFLFKMGM
jgi:catechol 2,3-dioxygenase-like lactoylglutathione lyase family enzyme